MSPTHQSVHPAVRARGRTLRWIGALAVIGCASLSVLLPGSGGGAVQAQATRTWVSGTGDDANSCSIPLPCKTFAGAISKTAAGGEIDVLNPGGYGAVTITKAITIDGTPFQAGVLASGTNGIVVNTATSDVVVLRGLSIVGTANAPNGIRFIGAGSLFVEQSSIDGFTGNPGHGIDFEPSAAAELYVTDTVIRDNGGSGIYVKSPGGVSTAAIDHAQLENNGAAGVNARDNARVSVRNSVAAGNSGAGFLAQADTGTAEMDVEDSVTTFNGTGVQASGNGVPAVQRISNVTIVDNTVGIADPAPGVVFSFLDNRNAGNGTDGAPNATAGPTATPTIAPAPTRTPTLTPTVTSTPTATATATPFPRPAVGVALTPVASSHTLQTTLTARDAACNGNTQNNQLLSLRFTRLANATVDVATAPVTTVTTAPTTVPLPAHPASIVVTVHRITDGQPTTVELVVTDGCGDWPTFIGGGPSAF
jgi:hypothetical protein